MTRTPLRGTDIRTLIASWLCAVALVGAPASPARGEEGEGNTASDPSTDDTTGTDDATQKKSFPLIPIPIFITEPAIGYGFGAAVGYFHKRKGDDEDLSEDIAPASTTGTSPGSGRGKEFKRPPTMSGVAAAYTDNGTWAVGVGHSASW